MARERSTVCVVVVAFLSLASMGKAQDRQEGGPGSAPPMFDRRPVPNLNVAPAIALMCQQAAELRARAREAQDLSDRLRRQADDLEQAARRQMGEPQEIKGAIERLRSEARLAKEQGRVEDSRRASQEADRLEQQLREQEARGNDQLGRPMPPEVQEILRVAEQAEREGRMEDARRQREKAAIVARQLQEQRRQGPGGGDPQEIKRKIDRLRNEARLAKEQGRVDDSKRAAMEADRLEQQLGEQGPRGPSNDEVMRGMEDLKQEIGRLWQAVNDLRNQPKEAKPM